MFLHIKCLIISLKLVYCSLSPFETNFAYAEIVSVPYPILTHFFLGAAKKQMDDAFQHILD